ncbi:aldo/keto reductase, partial [bacterium]
AQGLVTGKFTLENRPTDNRSGNNLFSDPTYGLALQAVELLVPIAERYGANTGQLALAWLIAQPGVTSPIVGSRNAAQIADIAKAAAIELSEADTAEISRIAQPVLDSQPEGKINPWAD